LSGGLPVAVEGAPLSKELLGALVGLAGGWLSARVSARRVKIHVKRGKNEVDLDVDRSQLEDADKVVQEIIRRLGK
jgi:hypothetical protein